MAKLEHLLRAAALGAILAAGSCAAPTSDANGTMEDPAVNNPILVEPAYQSLTLNYSPADAGLARPDAARLQAFVADYNSHGNGSIAVNAPAGPSARTAIADIAGRIADLGVPRDHILVATHDARPGDGRVELNFVSYRAHVAHKCADWSENLAYSADNQTPRNFGCSVQQNIAAQIADPRDLLGPRPMGEADPNRRAVIIDHYQKGEATAATKRTNDLGQEQSAPGTSVGAN